MWEFRRRPKDLESTAGQALEALFAALPELRGVYDLRWELTRIFEEAPDRATAATAIEDWRRRAEQSGLDWRATPSTAGPGRHVLAQPDELDALRPVQDKALRLERFLAPDQLNPLLFAGRSLYLVPDGPAAEPGYGVLRLALAKRLRPSHRESSHVSPVLR